jgi:hypothetical protein
VAASGAMVELRCSIVPKVGGTFLPGCAVGALSFSGRGGRALYEGGVSGFFFPEEAGWLYKGVLSTEGAAPAMI